jgi:hypothetical protein
MGWKTSCIFIQNPGNVDHGKVLQTLGFEQYSTIEAEPFEVALNPKEGQVYIGTYKDCLIICTPDIPLQIIETQNSALERAISSIFPKADISAFVLHSVVNLWGYTVLQNGKKIRARAGNCDDGTYLDQGDPLDAEQELLSQSTLDQNGQRVYYFKDDPDEAYSEDQVGENFVFALAARYTGDKEGFPDELLFETELNGYSVSKTNTSKTVDTTEAYTWKDYLIGAIFAIIASLLYSYFFK